MKEWLKKSANPVERKDLERHDKWLSMMWPRLKLLHDLSEDGAIFITIDDNEGHRLRSLMDEIFGEESFLANFVWQSKDTRATTAPELRKLITTCCSTVNPKSSRAVCLSVTKTKSRTTPTPTTTNVAHGLQRH